MFLHIIVTSLYQLRKYALVSECRALRSCFGVPSNITLPPLWPPCDLPEFVGSLLNRFISFGAMPTQLDLPDPPKSGFRLIVPPRNLASGAEESYCVAWP